MHVLIMKCCRQLLLKNSKLTIVARICNIIHHVCNTDKFEMLLVLLKNTASLLLYTSAAEEVDMRY